jgi:perosamine synthetase
MSQQTGNVRQVALSKPLIGKEEEEMVLKVLRSGMLAQGPVTEELEKKFAAYVGVPHAVAVSNGTAALQVALLAHGVGAGDEVLTSSFSFIASGNAVVYTGARPVFVDIDPVTYTLDIQQLEARITPRTKAIIPVHLFGLACDMEPIMALARKHNLAVVEDACQAHGATYDGKQVGSFGTGTYSFYPTKNMTSGEGGMITFNDEAASKRARLIRNHGMPERYKHTVLGYNLRMTDLHAAVGIPQLAALPARNDARRRNAAHYQEHLKGVVLPREAPRCKHVFHQYTIRVEGGRRDDMVKHLQARGVGVGIYYPRPIHQQPLYLEMGYKDALPVTEKAALEVLSLPVRPDMAPDELAQVVDAVNSFGA